MKNMFDNQHYSAVREVREAEYMPVTRWIPVHEYDGVKVMDVQTFKSYQISEMGRCWDDGWYLVAVLKSLDNESAAPVRVVWDNINSTKLEPGDVLKNQFQVIS